MADARGAVNADQPLLVAEGLSKTYGRLTACQDVSFVLYPGEVLAVVGESGSGKSTLLQLLSTQLAPTAGHGGQDCGAWSSSATTATGPAPFRCATNCENCTGLTWTGTRRR